LPRYTSKPGVDWRKIEERVRAGQSFRNIEEAIGTVTHQAISKRARKEGWTEEARLEAVAREFKATGKNGSSGIGNKIAIIHALEKGVPLKVAAGAVGVTEQTLLNWRNDDLVFRAECEQAQLKFVQSNLERIDAAAARGDWKAAVWQLSKHPKSKADYAEEKAVGGPSVQIVLSMPKPGQELEIIEAKAVDVTLEEKEPGNLLPSPESDVEIVGS
jgi:mannitol/fructose-specific phosphotransferase system IIA component (Ntr-type)